MQRALMREVSLRDGLHMVKGDLPAKRTLAWIADPFGYAVPGQVEREFSEFGRRLPATRISAHFHDTRGGGGANIASSRQPGITRCDASIGGLGGYSYAPGATGNGNAENVVFLLELKRYSTGIDIDRLRALRRKVERRLPGERFFGAIARADLPNHASSLQ